MEYVKAETLDFNDYPELNERWLHTKIEKDPSIIGLGNLILKDSERIQPGRGRLDLLLHDPESNRRYEVEIQLGKSDAPHIIRTIEYWDFERKRYPQYDHCAVLIAEDITSRFLNVISLFNGFIPIIAIQFKAVKIKNNISLMFTTVVDELILGTEEDDKSEKVDREYWETIGSKESVLLADSLLKLVDEFSPGFSLKYNQQYIGVSIDGVTKNFISFVPRKKSLIFFAKNEQNEDNQELLDSSDLDVLGYDRRYKQYRIQVTKQHIEDNIETLRVLIKNAYDFYMS